MIPDAQKQLLAAFAPRFFGEGNQLRWEAISSGKLPPATQERLEPWLDDLRAGADPLCLPRALKNGSVEWYLFAATERGARVLREQLLAFLGPSYSSFSGVPVHLDPRDPVDAAALDFFGAARTVRVRVPSEASLIDAARTRLFMFRSLMKARPARAARVVRPTGRILGDFEHALRSGNRTAAAECIHELRSLGRLTAHNLVFLNTRLLEAESDWEGILKLPELAALLDVPRPRLVTQAIIRAIYAAELRRFEGEGSADKAAAHFAQAIQPRFQGLFRTRAGMLAPEVFKCYMMLAAASTPPRAQLRDALLAEYPLDASDRPYLEALARQVLDAPPPAPSVDPLTAARWAFEEGDVDRAFAEALRIEGGYERLVLVLRCARDLDTLVAADTALAAVNEAEEALRARLLSHAAMRALWQRLTELSLNSAPIETTSIREPVSIPASWLDWLRRLDQPEPWPSAIAVAEHGALEWKQTALLHDEGAVQEIAQKLTANRAGWAEEALRGGLPHILTSFIHDEEPKRALKPIYEGLAYVLASDDQARSDHLAALTEITEALIRVGLTPGEYRDAIDTISEVWRRLGSGDLMDWALDTLDMLALRPAAAPDVRAGFLFQVAQYIRRHQRRALRDHVELLKGLCHELDVEFPTDLIPPAPRQTDGGEGDRGEISEALAGRTVALYSLREPVLQRVAQVLKVLCPSAQVSCFHDKVGGSPALKQQAATADVFIIATSAAKHAATTYIEAHRPAGAATLYAAGQGSASMLRAVRDYASMMFRNGNKPS